ncbi:MAG TPA: hypothetical protein PL182_13895, partial [Pseudobdellovibrionaceae bacterium]|nr:hypothetical protein [Pseudobdellovibrionaceae bacterium]
MTDQKKSACLISCEAYYVENPEARPSSTKGTCESASEFLSSGLSLQRNMDRFLGCSKGVWKGVLSIPDQLKAYLLMAESLGDQIRQNSQAHRKFIDECGRDINCRREIARLQVYYGARHPNGSYVVPDSEVDAKAGQENFLLLMEKAAHHQQSLGRLCLAELGNIRRDIEAKPGF